MLRDGKLKQETKLGEIAEQTHLFLLYKSVLPVSSSARPFQSRSFLRDAAGGDRAASQPGLWSTRLRRVWPRRKPMPPRTEPLCPSPGVRWPGLLCARPQSRFAFRGASLL